VSPISKDVGAVVFVLKIFDRFNPNELMQYNGMNTRTNTRRTKNTKLLI
jgi:hypothetical protein